MKSNKSLKPLSNSKILFRKNLFQIRSPLLKKSNQKSSQKKCVDKLHQQNMEKFLEPPQISSPAIQKKQQFIKRHSQLSSISSSPIKKHSITRSYINSKAKEEKSITFNNQKLQTIFRSNTEQSIQEQIKIINRRRRVTEYKLANHGQQKGQDLKMQPHINSTSKINICSNFIIKKSASINNKKLADGNKKVNYNKFTSIKSILNIQNRQQCHSLQKEQKVMEFKGVLGAGAKTQVRLATCSSSNNKYAVKVYSKLNLFSKLRKDRVYSQVKILSSLPSHNNIIKLVQAYENKMQIHLIFQYVQQSKTLYQYFNRNSANISQKWLKKVIIKILRAVAHLHNNEISHRDLKLQNIIIAYDQDNEIIIKIIDFGLACYVGDFVNDFHCGTPNYLSPELVTSRSLAQSKSKNKNHEINLFANDVWAIGVIVYYLTSGGNFPFAGKTQQQLYKNIYAGKIEFQDYTNKQNNNFIIQNQNLKNFLTRALQPKTSLRATIVELIHSDWFYQQ